MISEYHRPNTIEEALALLGRKDPRTVPIAGGSSITKPSRQTYAVVDLQGLGLDQIQTHGNTVEIGATTTLESLLHWDGLPDGLGEVIRHEATYNLRQVATIAGTLIAADGRSPFTTTLLALDARLTVLPGEEEISLGELLPLREERLAGRLIRKINFPLNAHLVYLYVARTPADLPLVCVAVVQWPSARTRVALGGYGSAPVLAFDGPDELGAKIAAQDAYADAGDRWATAQYRQQVAGVLTRRGLSLLLSDQ